MKHLVGKSSNGVKVFVDLITSEAARQISRQPHLLGLIGEVLQSTELRDPTIVIEQDMGRSIGYNFVVRTSPKDTIFYARLVGDQLYTRFVKNGQALPSRYLAITLRRDSSEEYELDNAWIGRLRPARPGTEDETAESRQYWLDHAFIPGDQPLQLRTVTKSCPY